MADKNGLVLVDRQALLVELQQVFDAQTASTLLGVLDKVAAQVHAAGMTREDFSELERIVAELAEAQQRTEQVVLLVDLIARGRPRQHTEMGDVWLAVEVAWVVNEDDVTRARRRADLLRQAGYRAIPAVAGERATLAAEDEARQHKVVVLRACPEQSRRDGRSFLWDEALSAWT